MDAKKYVPKYKVLKNIPVVLPKSAKLEVGKVYLLNVLKNACPYLDFKNTDLFEEVIPERTTKILEMKEFVDFISKYIKNRATKKTFKDFDEMVKYFCDNNKGDSGSFSMALPGEIFIYFKFEECCKFCEMEEDSLEYMMGSIFPIKDKDGLITNSTAAAKFYMKYLPEEKCIGRCIVSDNELSKKKEEPKDFTPILGFHYCPFCGRKLSE